MIKKLLIASAMFCAFSGTAHAQLITAKNPQSILNALSESGRESTLSKDSDGDPKISTKIGGANSIVLFYGCEKNVNCTRVQLVSGFAKKLSPEMANEINKILPFGRVYIDKDGELGILMDIDLDDGGMSKELFIDNVEYFGAYVQATLKRMDQ